MNDISGAFIYIATITINRIHQTVGAFSTVTGAVNATAKGIWDVKPDATITDCFLKCNDDIDPSHCQGAIEDLGEYEMDVWDDRRQLNWIQGKIIRLEIDENTVE